MYILHLLPPGPYVSATNILCNRESRVAVEPTFYLSPMLSWTCRKWVAWLKGRLTCTRLVKILQVHCCYKLLVHHRICSRFVSSPADTAEPRDTVHGLKHRILVSFWRGIWGLGKIPQGISYCHSTPTSQQDFWVSNLESIFTQNS